MDGENASRLVTALEDSKYRHDAVIVINCMPELMRRHPHGQVGCGRVCRLDGRGMQNATNRSERADKRTRPVSKTVDRLPGILKFVPTAGALTDAKHYLYLFCYFLQPTPANIQSMLLYALKHYVRDERLKASEASRRRA